MADWEMTSREWSIFNKQKKTDRIFEKIRYYCNCGHSVVIYPKEERTFCTFCGHYVYRDKRKQEKNVERIKKEDFKMQLRKEMKRAI